MKRIKGTLLIVTILGYLLPFINPGCTSRKAVAAPVNCEEPHSKELDDTTVSENKTIKPCDNLPVDDIKNQDHSIGSKSETLPFVERVFISPDCENLSGFGYLYLYFEKEYFCFFFSFVFLWIVAISHYFNFKVVNFENHSILTIGVLLLIIIGYQDFEILKFGFWIELFLYFVTLLIFFINRKNQTSSKN